MCIVSNIYEHFSSRKKLQIGLNKFSDLEGMPTPLLQFCRDHLIYRHRFLKKTDGNETFVVSFQRHFSS